MKPQYAAFGMPGGFEWVMIAIVVGFYLLPIVFVGWLIRYLIRSANEKKLMRLEIAKLADELEKLRKAYTGVPGVGPSQK